MNRLIAISTPDNPPQRSKDGALRPRLAVLSTKLEISTPIGQFRGFLAGHPDWIGTADEAIDAFIGSFVGVNPRDVKPPIWAELIRVNCGRQILECADLLDRLDAMRSLA